MPLLVATDVAARGLNIPDVELVLNYWFALTRTTCTVGRTGRAGGARRTRSSTVMATTTWPALYKMCWRRCRRAGQAAKFGSTVKKKEDVVLSTRAGLAGKRRRNRIRLRYALAIPGEKKTRTR